MNESLRLFVITIKGKEQYPPHYAEIEFAWERNASCSFTSCKIAAISTSFVAAVPQEPWNCLKRDVNLQ